MRKYLSIFALAASVAGCGEATVNEPGTTDGTGNEIARNEADLGLNLGFQFNQQIPERGHRMVIVGIDRNEVILSYTYDGQPTETIRYQESEERLEEGRKVAFDLGALLNALAEDDEFNNNRINRTCAWYSVFFGHHMTSGAGLLCDDTTYSPLSEALRDYMQPYLDEIPPPPPLP